jgi:hypothetical protein
MMPGLEASAQQPIGGQSVADRQRSGYVPIGARLKGCTGGALTIGTDSDFDGVISLAVGLKQQACDDSQIGALADPVLNLNVPWNPTQLTSVAGFRRCGPAQSGTWTLAATSMVTLW